MPAGGAKEIVQYLETKDLSIPILWLSHPKNKSNPYLEKATVKIKEYVTEKNYRIMYANVETTKVSFESLDDKDISQNRAKKIAKRLYYVLTKPSMRNINNLLYTISKTNEKDGKFKIVKSKKELEIQSKRKVWKELRDLAEKARLEYIEEKGDFYKKS